MPSDLKRFTNSVCARRINWSYRSRRASMMRIYLIAISAACCKADGGSAFVWYAVVHPFIWSSRIIEVVVPCEFLHLDDSDPSHEPKLCDMLHRALAQEVPASLDQFR